MAKKKLIPLMPILVRLRACADGMEAVKAWDAPTFAALWERCDEPAFLRWVLTTALCDAGMITPHEWDARVTWFEAQGISHGDNRRSRWSAVETFAPKCDLVRARFDRAEVERALYDYAVREGLA